MLSKPYHAYANAIPVLRRVAAPKSPSDPRLFLVTNSNAAAERERGRYVKQLANIPAGDSVISVVATMGHGSFLPPIHEDISVGFPPPSEN